MHIRRLEILIRDPGARTARKLAYRFYPGQKDHRYTYGVQIANASEMSHFINACRFAVAATNKIPDGIESVTLECYDDSGTLWTSIKDRMRTLTLRDGEEVASHPIQREAGSSGAAMPVLNLRTMHYEPDAAAPLKLGQAHAPRISAAANETADGSDSILCLEEAHAQRKERLCAALGQDPSRCRWSTAQLRGMLGDLTEILGNLAAKTTISALVRDDLKRSPSIDEFRLRDQILQLKKVDTAFNHYQSAQKIASRIQSLIHRNEELLAEVGGGDGELTLTSFEQIFEAAQTYVAARMGEFQEQSAEAWLFLMEGKLQPDFQQYLNNLENIVLQGAHISSRIDMEIRNGSAGEAQEERQENHGVISAGRFLFRKTIRQMKTIEENRKQFRSELAAHFRDVSDMSLHLGEIRELMGHAHESLRELKTESLRALNDSQAHFTEPRRNWSEISAAIGVPDGIGTAEFFSVLHSGLLRIQLTGAIGHLRTNMSYLSESRDMLVASIEEWRRLSKSVDQTSLGDDTLLFAEARKLVRYLQEKDELRRQLAENRAELLTNQALTQGCADADLANKTLVEAVRAALPAPESFAFDATGAAAAALKARCSDIIEAISAFIEASDLLGSVNRMQLKTMRAPFQILTTAALERHEDLNTLLSMLESEVPHPYFARILIQSAASGLSDFSGTAVGHLKRTAAEVTANAPGPLKAPASGSVGDSFPAERHPRLENAATSRTQGAQRIPAKVTTPALPAQQTKAAESAVLKKTPGTSSSPTNPATPPKGPTLMRGPQYDGPANAPSPVRNLAQNKIPAEAQPMHPLADSSRPLSPEARRALEILTSKPRVRS